MAKYSAIKALVNAYIKRNGKKEITGSILNSVLTATIDSLGKYYQFAGYAMPTDNPGTPDQNVCYLAGEPGIYQHFNRIIIRNEEVALLFWDGTWQKKSILLGIQEVSASVDNNTGIPSVDVSYSQGNLVLTFHNLKGEKGNTGDAAGFGTIGADVDGNIGTPGVSVETSGDDTAKNLMFHFTNLKGETGVTSVVATIDNTSGTPSCQVSLVGQQLTLAFSGLKGLKGDTGVSADYPITIYNGLDSDATDAALSAAQGKVLDGKVTELEAKVDEFRNPTEVTLVTETPQRRWENVNGKVELGTDVVSVTSMKPVSIAPFTPFSVTADESGTAAKAYFITDENDNILMTGWDSGTVKTETGIAPEGAAKIYINSLHNTTGVPALVLGESIFKHLNILDGKVKDWVFILRGIVDSSTSRNNMSPQDGDLFYQTNDKAFYLCTAASPLTFVTVQPIKDGIYINGKNLYVWNGVDLVSAFTEQVIYIKKFSTYAPSGISEGDYYYNTNTKGLYRKLNGQYNTKAVPLKYDTIYLYEKNIYLYNGTELFIPFVTSTDVSTMVDAAVETAVETAVDEYGARIIEDNTTPLELSEDDFVLGNLNGNTGAEISAPNVVRSGFIEVVPGAGFAFQTSNNYRCDIFMYDADKAFVTHFGWKTGTYTNTLSERASYIRIVLASPSGTSTAPVWQDAALSVTIDKKYVPTRALGEKDVQKAVDDYFDLELPIFAPSPQLPANDSEDSDFNAETVTSEQLYTALDNLISSIQKPEGRNGNYPKMLTKYDVSGLDASGVYPIYTYALTRRNRYAFRNADELYAWKDANDNLVFIDSCSPFVGQAIYSDSNRTASGKTIASYNSATGVMTSSDSVSYTRAEESNVAAKMFWTKISMQNSSAAGAIYGAFDENDNSLGNATFVDSTHLTFGGKTYTRAECFDYHNDRKATIFIWGNEHGPTSDPLEPSIILYRLAKDLVSGCRNNPFLMFLKQYCKIVFIPCANPWGCQYPRVYGRQNSAGVNINRNYDTPGWAVQESTEKGAYAGDQPETQYIMNMCKRFSPNISIDVHCLGFGNPLSEGLMYLSETAIPEPSFYARTQATMFGLGFMFDQRGNPEPLQMAHGSEWMDYYGMMGGVFEMNAGPYSDNSHTYDGRQHTASVMEACYTELLNCIRMWLAKYDPTIDLSKMCIK